MNGYDLHIKNDNAKSINVTVKGQGCYKLKVKKATRKSRFYTALSIVFFAAAVLYAVIAVLGICKNWSGNGFDNTSKILESALYTIIPISCGVTALFISKFKTSDRISILSLVIALASLIISTVK